MKKPLFILYLFLIVIIFTSACDRVDNPGQAQLTVIPPGNGTYTADIDIGNGLVTSETGTTDSFSIVLSDPPTGDVIIPITSGNTGEVTLSTASLTFTSADWDIAQTVIVYGQDDTGAVDGTQTVNINFGTITSTDTNYNGSTHTPLTVFNLDDDEPASVVILDTADNVITENGKTCSIILVLNRQPTSAVELTSITSTAIGEGNPNISSLTIDPADWSIPNVITVEPIDNTSGGNVYFDIDFGTTTSLDSAFNNLTPGTVNILKKRYVNMNSYAAGYTEPTGISYVSISGSGNVANLSPVNGIAGNELDDGFAYLGIGFKFLYMGIPQEFIVVYTDGFASLSPQTFSLENSNNEHLFDNSYYTKILAPWWDDMNIGGAGNIYYLTDGTSPNRVFTVEYNSIARDSTDNVYNFQIKLYESTGVIEFVYGTSSGVSNGTEASIGLKSNINPAEYFDGSGGSTETLLDLIDFQALSTVKRFDPYNP